MKAKVKLIFATMLLVVLLLSGCMGGGERKSSAGDRESAIYRVSEVKAARVTANQLDVKSGAGESFNTIYTLDKGQIVDVLGEIDGWYAIHLDNNRVGCIDSAYTEPVVKDTKKGGTANQTSFQPNETGPAAKSQAAPAASAPTNDEQQMLNMLNQSRKENNLPPLTVDPDLTRLARMKSQDMIDKDYFSHYSPTYGSPFDMMDANGVAYQTAGENIAENDSVTDAENRLMQSSGHRQNILNQEYTHIGIGIKRKDKESLMFTQMFVGRPR